MALQDIDTFIAAADAADPGHDIATRLANLKAQIVGSIGTDAQVEAVGAVVDVVNDRYELEVTYNQPVTQRCGGSLSGLD
jgi:hypothetical protein